MLDEGKFIQGCINLMNGKVEAIINDQILLSVNWSEQLRKYEEKVLFVGTDIDLHIEGINEKLGGSSGDC